IPVVEDACQAIKSSWDGQPAGRWGELAAFSFHPLKFLNIWGDGGMIVTGEDSLAERLGLLRNHGLASRDEVVSLGCNSRLGPIQAVVGCRVLGDADWILRRRLDNAAFYDAALSRLSGVALLPRNPRLVHSFVTYQLLAERRDELLSHCVARGIECKVHYP